MSKIWPSHHRDAQNNYDLEKINVEWSAQNNDYDLEKINVEWSGTHLKIMSTRSWKCLQTKNKCSGLISPKIITTSKK